MSISEQLQAIKKNLAPQTTLVAVSKLQDPEKIKEAYAAGHLDFGENYIQELREKQSLLPPDIRWHFIGHLQRNKVKYIAPFVYLIHGVDSVKLLDEIERQGKKIDRIIPVLLQIHISREESKFGFDEQELFSFIEQLKPNSYQNIRIEGLMGMASFTENKDLITAEFAALRQNFDKVGGQFGGLTFGPIKWPYIQMNTLSMGMSGDYELALNQGSTLVRIGSAIFGNRPAKNTEQ